MVYATRKSKPSLPSPPLSGSLIQETETKVPRSRSVPRLSSEQRTHPLSLDYTEGPLPKKRKRNSDREVLHNLKEHGFEGTVEGDGGGYTLLSDRQHESAGVQDPTRLWVENGCKYSAPFFIMSEPESDRSSKRRRSSTQSYSSRVRDGSAPPAHTAAYEEELQRHGIMFNDPETKDLVTHQSRKMCEALLAVTDLGPIYSSCSEDTYIKIFQRATKGNEERVRRDLTPRIVPSAELLYIHDGNTALSNVREEMSSDWMRCSLLGGTQPRPDYAYGLSSASFTEEERVKMENYTNIDNPTKFTESMYFPFLLCEAKCGKKNINDADRQSVHSASIAVNAILKLCSANGGDAIEKLSGEVLVFSISHDNERVKIYGHFPVIKDGRTTFHRFYVHDYSLDGHYGQNRDVGPNFTRALYRDFYPAHLQRIKEAIARLPDPQTTSIVSDFSGSEIELPVSEQSSQERNSSPRPSLRRAKSRGSQGELTLMKQQMAKTEQIYKAQMELQQKQMEQQKEDSRRQMEQQKEDSRRQMELQQEQSQRQIALLERLLGQKQ